MVKKRKKPTEGRVLLENVEGHPEANYKFTSVANLRNTTSANRALNFFGVSDEVEKTTFMGKVESESYNARPEGMKYTNYNGWRNLNGQINAYCRAFQRVNNYTNKQMEEWNEKLRDEERANIMYGIEG